ncbi:MAG: aminoacyl-tRNA hydrolase [Acidimicrobiales bacterium]
MLRRRNAGGRKGGTPADLVVVGLGNPGSQYHGTRHNIGAAVVELLSDRHGGRLRKTKELAFVDEVRIADKRVVLAFPQTFMNESGQSVGRLMPRHGVTEFSRLLVVHDELDLPVGRLKVKLGGGLAGHNGLKSIQSHIHTADFGRVRIGVGRPDGKHRGAGYVLKPPAKREREELDVVCEEAADAVEMVLTDGYEAAMTRYNVS